CELSSRLPVFKIPGPLTPGATMPRVKPNGPTVPVPPSVAPLLNEMNPDPRDPLTKSSPSPHCTIPAKELVPVSVNAPVPFLRRLPLTLPVMVPPKVVEELSRPQVNPPTPSCNVPEPVREPMLVEMLPPISSKPELLIVTRFEGLSWLLSNACT